MIELDLDGRIFNNGFMKKILFLSLCLLLSLTGCQKKTGGSSDTSASEPDTPEIIPEETQDIISLDFPKTEEKTAYQWNDLGFEAYERQEYRKAAVFFSRAIAADSSYLYAHYNLACMMSLLINDDRAFTMDIPQDIIDELIICQAINPETVGQNRDWISNQIIDDPDLEKIRSFNSHFESLKQQDYKYWQESLQNSGDEIENYLSAIRQNNPGLLTALLFRRIPDDTESLRLAALENGNPAVIRLVLGWPGILQKPYALSPEVKAQLARQDSSHSLEDLFLSSETLQPEEETIELMIKNYLTQGVGNGEYLPLHNETPMLPPIKTQEGYLPVIFENSLHIVRFADNRQSVTPKKLVVAEVLFIPTDKYSALKQLDKNDLGVFGDLPLGNELRKEVYYLLYNEENETLIKAFKDSEYWRPIIYNDIHSVEPLSSYPAVVYAITYDNFISGWFRSLKILAIHYQDLGGGEWLDESEPLTLESEWLGGPQVETTFENLRFTENQIVVIDKIEEGNRETLQLFFLAQ